MKIVCSVVRPLAPSPSGSCLLLFDTLVVRCGGGGGGAGRGERRFSRKIMQITQRPCFRSVVDRGREREPAPRGCGGIGGEEPSSLAYYYIITVLYNPLVVTNPTNTGRPTDRFIRENARDLISTHMYAGLRCRVYWPSVDR